MSSNNPELEETLSFPLCESSADELRQLLGLKGEEELYDKTAPVDIVEEES